MSGEWFGVGSFRTATGRGGSLGAGDLSVYPVPGSLGELYRGTAAASMTSRLMSAQNPDLVGQNDIPDAEIHDPDELDHGLASSLSGR